MNIYVSIPTLICTCMQCDKSPSVVDGNYLLLFGEFMTSTWDCCQPFQSIHSQWGHSFCTDTRSSADYNEGHIQLAKLAKKEKDDKTYRVPFGTHLSTCLHCVVYDSNTVSVIENSESRVCVPVRVGMRVSFSTAPATQLANQLASSGSKHQVHVLKGEHTIV